MVCQSLATSFSGSGSLGSLDSERARLNLLPPALNCQSCRICEPGRSTLQALQRVEPRRRDGAALAAGRAGPWVGDASPVAANAFLRLFPGSRTKCCPSHNPIRFPSNGAYPTMIKPTTSPLFFGGSFFQCSVAAQAMGTVKKSPNEFPQRNKAPAIQ